jgi:hypothetical protein
VFGSVLSAQYPHNKIAASRGGSAQSTTLCGIRLSAERYVEQLSILTSHHTAHCKKKRASLLLTSLVKGILLDWRSRNFWLEAKAKVSNFF